MRFAANRALTVALVLVALCAAARPASAAPIVDQSQPLSNVSIGNFGDQAAYAQSFQQTNDNIAGAGVLLNSTVADGSTLTISVWDDLPNQVGAMMLATGTSVAVTGGFFDIFWTPVPITPGVTHYLQFTSSGTSLDLGGRIDNPYPLGQVYASTSYNSFPNLDLAFRTYYEPVPEPASWLLFFAALAGVSCARTARIGRG